MNSSRKNAKIIKLMTFLCMRSFAAVALITIVTGCASLRELGVQAPVAPYQPQNIHRAVATLPSNVQRLAVLPLVCSSASFDSTERRGSLEQLLREELAATKKFEVISATPETLRSSTGQNVWSDQDTLPVTFFDSLRQNSGCDAVLFSEVTVFRAYSPLAIGWRFKLVDARTKQVLWAADELFDANQLSVQSGAHRFGSSSEESWTMLNSPQRFGQYTVATLMATLPDR
jgi:hypothetical protein